MKRIRIGTFNTENLYFRYKFKGPAVVRGKKESKDVYDARVLASRKKALQDFQAGGGELDWFSTELENFSTISGTQRKATAAVLEANDPDIVALMEVESLEALRKFNSSKFFPHRHFEHSMLIDSYDPRGIDVAVLSKYPFTHLRSYADDSYVNANGKTVRTFSRDCLVVQIEVDGKPLTLFINHLKSQLKDNPERRLKQATRVEEIVKATFGTRLQTELFAVVGDFNQSPDDPSLVPLVKANWNTDVLSTLPNVQDRWTHLYEKNEKVQSVSQLDYILLSRQLESQRVGYPIIERRGLARYKGLDPYYPDTTQRILRTVDKPGTEASDHCPVFVDVEV